MTKKIIRPRLDAGRLQAERIKLVSERKPEDIRFAPNGASGVRPASERGTNGLKPVGQAIWRVVNNIRPRN